MKRFESNLEWWLYLTRQEYQVLMAVSVCLLREGILSMTTPTLGASMLGTVEYLSRMYGWTPGAINIDEEGFLWTDETEPVTPEIKMSLTLLHRGGSPAYEEHFPFAIGWLPDNIPDFPVEMVKEEWHRFQEAEKGAKAYAKAMPKETREKLKEEILAAAGVTSEIPGGIQ